MLSKEISDLIKENENLKLNPLHGTNSFLKILKTMNNEEILNNCEILFQKFNYGETRQQYLRIVNNIQNLNFELYVMFQVKRISSGKQLSTIDRDFNLYDNFLSMIDVCDMYSYIDHHMLSSMDYFNVENNEEVVEKYLKTDSKSLLYYLLKNLEYLDREQQDKVVKKYIQGALYDRGFRTNLDKYYDQMWLLDKLFYKNEIKKSKSVSDHIIHIIDREKIDLFSNFNNEKNLKIILNLIPYAHHKDVFYSKAINYISYYYDLKDLKVALKNKNHFDTICIYIAEGDIKYHLTKEDMNFLFENYYDKIKNKIFLSDLKMYKEDVEIFRNYFLVVC